MKKYIGLTVASAVLIPAGMAAAGTYDYQWNGFLDIPDSDPAGTFVDIVVPDSFTIADLNVDLIIEHTWQGDLIVTLEHLDDGVTAGLLYRPGDSLSAGFGFSADNIGNPATGEPMWLDDEADAPYDSAQPNGIGAVADPGIDNVTGSWIPYGAGGVMGELANFDNTDAAGTWRLHVSDTATGDTGAILQYSLHFTAVPAPGALALLGLAGLAGRRRRRA